MHELELKFAVPSYQQSVLRKNIDTKTAQQQRLSAYYFDTPNQDLAKKGIALRIRFEDSQWVQTLKTAGDGVAKRVEINTVLSLTGTPDTLDVSSLVPDVSLITEPTVVAELTNIMPIDAVRANDFQILLLELIGFTHLPVPADSPKAKATVAKKLQKLFTAIAAASDKFASLDTESQHGVRKDLKSLRYVSEFAAPLFASQNNGKKGKKATKLNAFLQYLEPAQDVLGEYNDNVVGHANYLEKAKTDPNALFAVGWFSGREQASAEQCAVSLKTVKNAPKFW